MLSGATKHRKEGNALLKQGYVFVKGERSFNKLMALNGKLTIQGKPVGFTNAKDEHRN